ncbi:16S rRNA (guanine(966)-N(2))-methyltransferase RsmD [Marinobacterium arenosum]|uniref:16S rRNA (guanine(966)-N(2))-methyltransferase RsmD n=1 Tax=Marinobacterium arenosum TaxID=2862496 RepID=UPI001C939AB2|nr:16S rRNA (guanine(966)-N(2))-methyltransferase RsmD [Marinobacterium arenosum]MBY4678634.1 16S rRNA (guanine(966)-N(2))-methyltransferase RsmD [Marinobacterium arenosum]
MGRRHPTRARQSRSPQPEQSTLRLIGGEWRGRKIPFPAIDGLRPTPDRVRETLFNWLQPYIAGARCLDLYSGSGALGLEALSRGAELVTFVERDPLVGRQLQSNLQLLKCNRAQVVQAAVGDWLASRQTDLEEHYDIVFMDPPYRQGLVAQDCALLEARGMLAAQAIIYVETEAELIDAGIPGHWLEHRRKTTGQVCSQLYFRQPD